MAGQAHAGAGGSLAPPDSWDEMQQLEYNIGLLAAGLNLCRRYSLSGELRALSKLSPYGQRGYRAAGAYDDINSAACGGMVKSARQVLGDKKPLQQYLKAKYACNDGKCIER